MALSSFRAAAAALIISAAPLVSGLAPTSALAWGQGYGEAPASDGGGYGGNPGGQRQNNPWTNHDTLLKNNRHGQTDDWGKRQRQTDDWGNRRCDHAPCTQQGRNQDDWGRGRGGDNDGWNRRNDSDYGRHPRRDRDDWGHGQADGYGRGQRDGGGRGQDDGYGGRGQGRHICIDNCDYGHRTRDTGRGSRFPGGFGGLGRIIDYNVRGM